jgi:hypothetical protein
MLGDKAKFVGVHGVVGTGALLWWLVADRRDAGRTQFATSLMNFNRTMRSSSSL